MKTVTILRGIPGSGNSSYVEQARFVISVRLGIVSADHYFMKDGRYDFDPTKLKEAHEYCFNTFKHLVDKNFEHIYVDNTNTRIWEFQKYMDYAKQNGYEVKILKTLRSLHEQLNFDEISNYLSTLQDKNFECS